MNEEQRKFWEALAEGLELAANQIKEAGQSKDRARFPSTAEFSAATTLAGLSAAIQHTLDETE